jgi:hypothetical protein
MRNRVRVKRGSLITTPFTVFSMLAHEISIENFSITLLIRTVNRCAKVLISSVAQRSTGLYVSTISTNNKTSYHRGLVASRPQWYAVLLEYCSTAVHCTYQQTCRTKLTSAIPAMHQKTSSNKSKEATDNRDFTMNEDEKTTSRPAPTSDRSPGTFPGQLYMMLEDASEQGFGDIVSWLPNGAGFKVHKKQNFEESMMGRYFNTQTQFKSFLRQLNVYGFHRVASGRDRGCYFHKGFLRNSPELCNNLRPAKKVSFGGLVVDTP